jgi:hypothetical protein
MNRSIATLIFAVGIGCGPKKSSKGADFIEFQWPVDQELKYRFIVERHGSINVKGIVNPQASLRLDTILMCTATDAVRGSQKMTCHFDSPLTFADPALRDTPIPDSYTMEWKGRQLKNNDSHEFPVGIQDVMDIIAGSLELQGYDESCTAGTSWKSKKSAKIMKAGGLNGPASYRTEHSVRDCGAVRKIDSVASATISAQAADNSPADHFAFSGTGETGIDTATGLITSRTYTQKLESSSISVQSGSIGHSISVERVD